MKLAIFCKMPMGVINHFILLGTSTSFEYLYGGQQPSFALLEHERAGWPQCTIGLMQG